MKKYPHLYADIFWHLTRRGALTSAQLAQCCQASVNTIASRCVVLAARGKIQQHIRPPGVPPRVIWSLPNVPPPDGQPVRQTPASVAGVTADDLAWMRYWSASNRQARREQRVGA